VADLTPIKERLAKCVRLFGSTERANARVMTERALESVGASWTDFGDWIEHSYSESEVLEAIAAAGKEKLEQGVKIGKAQTEAEARLHNGRSRAAAALSLPSPTVMAAFCHERREQLNEWEQSFIDDMHVGGKARRFRLSVKQQDKLQDLYQQLGGT
jgi:hypothetical protein